jgi:tetratricopeptide (TPR) repeat protein
MKMRTITSWVGLAILALALGVDAGTQTVRTPTAEARLVEAERALAAGEREKAMQLASEYVTAHESSTRARILIARVHIERGELDPAYEQLRLALATEPRNVDVLYYLGLVAAQMSQQTFERLAKMAPDSGRVHQLQAESLEAQESNAAAEAEYEAALRVQPDLFDALVGLARLKRIRLACDEAVTLYEKAERIRPTFETAYGLGTCNNVLQQDEVATAYFEKAVRRNPKAAAAWVGLGASLNKLGRPADAVTKLQKAIALEPTEGQAYYFLGIAYRALKDPVRAQEAFKKAEELGGAMGGPGRSAVPSTPRTPR